ncbi:tetratricopeptide repeat protein 17 isoform X2 [Agrilus planipennis]|uniref:Tetratricopeptide repeat protein 17 isoform X2 n=1 Tax=Agrilus planipennis TaxID=224129 RepID=A0A1W4XEL0_AGRPL|nr:tetratricopeptide repeat protein 17 isoform X2 [Agrilus planipennis]
MIKCRLYVCFVLLFYFTLQITATTHWVVTENGRIQTQLDSPFHLRRPYDLIALLDQETRQNNINALYKDLINRKNEIDQKWAGLDGTSDLESKIYSQDQNCLKAEKPLSEIDLYASIGSNGSEREALHKELQARNYDGSTTSSEPDCSKHFNMDFSMFAYEHLGSMINRHNLTLTAEIGLKHLLSGLSTEEFGSLIVSELEANTSSWLHYNLGILYWRIKGNAPKAIECARRALFFVPREYQDIPLLNLAGIFHQSHNHKDAAILLHAAIDHAPAQPLNYLALGNVYAALTDFNRSVACYDNVLRLQPDYDIVATVKYATLCHKKLETLLSQLHDSLQQILSDLHEYHGQQQQWLRLQERLLWEQVPFETRIAEYGADKIETFLSHRGQRCVQRDAADSKSTIICDFTDTRNAVGLHVDMNLNLEKLLKNVESETLKISEQMSRSKNFAGGKTLSAKKNKKGDVKEIMDESSSNSRLNSINFEGGSFNIPPAFHPKYPTTLSLSNDLYFDATSWPSKEECVKWNLPPNPKELLNIPVFLPPENKGFQVSKAISDLIDLPNGFEHSLPWYPPICEHSGKDFNKIYLPSSVKQTFNKPLKMHPFFHKHFVNYINDGKVDEAEIGQRIITAMYKKTAPGWLLATLASYYWQIRSNTKNALNCLDLAFQTVPKDYTDVVIISISSVLHQLDLVDDALKFAMLAFQVNYVEPSTNFLLALLHYKKNNPILAMYYMKNVLRVEPNYYNGLAENLLKTWACSVKLGSYEDEKIKIDKITEGMCSDKDSFRGEGVICSANGEQCKTASIQCFRTEAIKDPILEKEKISLSNCGKSRGGFGRSFVNNFMNGDKNEPDQSHLETMNNYPHQTFHMRISLGSGNGEAKEQNENVLGDFYVSVSLTDDPLPEPLLHVYDKSGTYPLSATTCRDIRDSDWLHFSSMWQSIATRNMDISSLLKSTSNNEKGSLKPYCSDAAPAPKTSLDYLTSTLIRKKLQKFPEPTLMEWLTLMANDDRSSLQELGVKLSRALQEQLLLHCIGGSLGTWTKL